MLSRFKKLKSLSIFNMYNKQIDTSLRFICEWSNRERSPESHLEVDTH